MYVKINENGYLNTGRSQSDDKSNIRRVNVGHTSIKWVRIPRESKKTGHCAAVTDNFAKC